jgi:hypothetical protein
MSGTKGTGGPREEIDTGSNKLYARRNDEGRFGKVTDEGKSLSADRRTHARSEKPDRQGDKGD